MANTFFTADLHLGHKNIMKYCDRPWETVEEMNAALVERWNSVVGPDDTVWVLGDLTLKQPSVYKDLFLSLNGSNKYLIAGNHDRCFYAFHSHRSDEVFSHYRNLYSECGFTDIYPVGSRWMRVESCGLQDGPLSDHKVLFSHYPVKEVVESQYVTGHEPSGIGHWNLCGHVHNAWKHKGMSINIGVDVWDYTPVSAAQVADVVMDILAAPQKE